MSKVICSSCGEIDSDDVEVIDQTIGCKRCGGIDWHDDGITIEFVDEDDELED